MKTSSKVTFTLQQLLFVYHSTPVTNICHRANPYRGLCSATSKITANDNPTDRFRCRYLLLSFIFWHVISVDPSPWPTNFAGLHNGSSDESHFKWCAENGRSTKSSYPSLVGTLGPDRLYESLVVLRWMTGVSGAGNPAAFRAVYCIPGSHRW